jgi:hypothetical protein
MLSIAFGIAMTVATASPTPMAAQAKDPCCFTNPRYTGVCKVVPAEDETCGDILAYLNNQSSVGKSYCGNTTIRGGWTQVNCDADNQSVAACEAPPTVPAGG